MATADPDPTQTTTTGRSRISTYTLYGFGQSFDWKTTHFLEPLPQSRQCSYCGLVPSSMALLPCCHLVCSSCYYQCQDKYTCALDGKDFVQHDVGWAVYTTENLAMRDILCWNVDNGCDTSGPLLQVLDHYNGSCWYHPVVCPYCYRVVKNGGTLAHLSLGCYRAPTVGGSDSHERISATSGRKEAREKQPQISDDSLESESPSHRQQSGGMRPSRNASTSSQTGAIPKRFRDALTCSPILGPSVSAAELGCDFRDDLAEALVGDRPQPAATLWDQSEDFGCYSDPGIADYIKPERQAQLSKYTEKLRQIDVAYESIDALMAQSLQHVAGHDGASSSTMHGGGVSEPDLYRENVHGGPATDPAGDETEPPQQSVNVGVASAPSRESASDLAGESPAAPLVSVPELATPLGDPALSENPVVVTECAEIEEVIQNADVSDIMTPTVRSEEKPLTEDIKPTSSEGPVKGERHVSSLDSPEVGRAIGEEGTGGTPAGPSHVCLSLLRAQQDAISQCLRTIVAGMKDVKEFLHKIVTEDLPLHTANYMELRARMIAHATAWSTLRQELKNEMRIMMDTLASGSGVLTTRDEVAAEGIAPDRLTQKIDVLLHASRYFLQEVLRSSHPVEWCLDNWSELRAQAVAEGEAAYHYYIPLVCLFYGYSISPGIKIDSSQGLPRVYMSVVLRKGQYDYFVDWPMEKELVLSILHPTDRGKVRTLVIDTRHGNAEHYLMPEDDDGRGPFFSLKSIKTTYFDSQGYVAGDKLLLKFEVKISS